MTDEPEFLRRWSRRKQAARKPAKGAGPAEPDAPQREPDESPAASKDPTEPSESPAAVDEALDLPDIDSLTAESDFTPFMKPGVPEALKNRALRKLWRINPVFGRLDGLNDYDGDFTDAASVVKDLKTLYKVGRGFLPDPKESAAETGPEEMQGGDPQPDSGETPKEAAADPRGTDEDGENGNKVT